MTILKNKENKNPSNTSAEVEGKEGSTALDQMQFLKNGKYIYGSSSIKNTGRCKSIVIID